VYPGENIHIIIPVGNDCLSLKLHVGLFCRSNIFFLFLVIRKQTKNRLIAASVSLLYWVFPRILVTKVTSQKFIPLIASSSLPASFFYNDGRKKHSNRILYFLASMCGLGCTNHHTMAPLSILFALYISLNRAASLPLPFKVMGIACFNFCFALSVYLYLPIRSQANPYMNWGQPDTIKKSIQHVLRSQYKIPSDAGYIRSWISKIMETFGKQIMVYASAFVEQFTWGLFWLPHTGTMDSFSPKRNVRLLSSFTIFLLTSIGFYHLPNFMRMRKVSCQWISFSFLHICGAIWMGTDYIGSGKYPRKKSFGNLYR